MKYPIGIQSFDQLREEGYVYVDKTALIYDLVQNGKIYFLSRPRRFGKSLLVSTLDCYFQGRKELFGGLAIAALEKDWAQYPVFRMDFNSTDYTIAGKLESSIEWYVIKWERQYGIDPSGYPAGLSQGDRFKEVLQRACRQTGRRCVVLIDEYDKPVLDVLGTNAKAPDASGEMQLLEDRHRNTLKAFYSTFKAADQYLKFVLLTGVTKFSQVSVFSGFNQPYDISMDKRYEALCGITDEEIDRCFAESVAELAESCDTTPAQMRQDLRRQYDGYHFSTRMTGIYNPFSILNAFTMKELRNYWFASGTPTYLLRLLSHSREQMDEMLGKYYFPNMFVDYKAGVEQLLPMIYQSGYLTIKDYDRDTNSFMLDYPNNEVRQGFLTLVASNYFKPQADNVSVWLIEAARQLQQGDTDSFRRSLTAFLASIPYDAHQGYGQNERATEKHFQYTFYLILRLLGVYALRIEERQSKRRVDCILEMRRFIYIFEFKLNGTATDALRQIEEKGYARPYAADERKVTRIGISFSSQTGTVEEWEEA